jgi:hypothetical protein
VGLFFLYIEFEFERFVKIAEMKAELDRFEDVLDLVDQWLAGHDGCVNARIEIHRLGDTVELRRENEWIDRDYLNAHIFLCIGQDNEDGEECISLLITEW